MSSRVLVTGAAGFLGWYVGRAFVAAGWEVVGTSRDGGGVPAGVSGAVLSLEDGGGAGAALVERVRPDVVVHLAAEADADRCAREPERARRVNVDATGALARAAGGAGAWFVTSSSDLVFDGTAAPYGEEDPTSPLGPYMASKADGEGVTLAASPRFLVARTALLYGLAGGRKGCFTDAILARLRAGEAVPLFEDQHRTPLLVTDAARALVDLTARRPGGILHLAGPQRVSRLEHGLALARAFDLDLSLCRPTRVAELPGLAPRPADTSLRIDRLVALLGWSPLDVAAGCARLAEGA